MKIKSLLLSAVLILPLLMGGVVAAQAHEDGDQSVSNQTTTTDTGMKKTREERITARKAQVKERLTQIQQNRVKLVCRAANGKIKAAHARIGSFEAKRTKVYSGLVTRLEGLSAKLKAAGVDTTQYDQQVAILKTKAAAFDSALADLKQAAEDLETMDCTADPEGFMATLKEAHELRMDVIKKGQDFRNYLRGTFKATFAETRTQLQAKKTEGEG
ncbi:MAG TPA: hypothetical protein VK674_06255 [Candidatus Limnocylindria bacterium]|nr:hypothetical protein [Candidatus Limnocylindria bacterium]